jgi:hypothetical protein
MSMATNTDELLTLFVESWPLTIRDECSVRHIIGEAADRGVTPSDVIDAVTRALNSQSRTPELYALGLIRHAGKTAA